MSVAGDTRGFTLAEVLVAAALSLMSVLAVSSLSLQAYERLTRSERTITAASAAQQRLEWLRSHDYDDPALADGTSVTRPTGVYDGFTITTTIDDDTPVAGVKRISVLAVSVAGHQVRLDTILGRGAS